MSTPTGDNTPLHELEVVISAELTQAETSAPEVEVETDGVRAADWLPDPDAERYEVRLRTLLGAVEALEDGSRPVDRA